ncbi:MAG: hypothetical protein NTV93_02295 [Verrucomicrobia bacterium]|nr:hypothetical protein [Verrucomicrobiota bacterium]
MKLSLLLVLQQLVFSFVSAHTEDTYGDDIAFLKEHTDIIELSNDSQRVAIAPAWQGRVMTSTANGSAQAGFGWIHREVIAKGIQPEAERTGLQKHIHVFGGEERFWLGPEGGTFALFFPPKAAQTFDNWKTPAAIDTEPFDLVEKKASQIVFSKDISLLNRAGTTLNLRATRRVSLKTQSDLAAALGLDALPAGVKAVAYQTDNTVKNTGEVAWNQTSGAPSIWLLGMFKPTPQTTVVIPFLRGSGVVANTNYAGFGQISPDRVTLTSNVLFFNGDGTTRGKLGIKPKRATPWAGSWQADKGVLTLIKVDLPSSPPANQWPYADSQWKDGGDPFDGDAINSYNDGPASPDAKPLGPFYEIESCSPALFLAPGETYTHTQQTFHLIGQRASLDAIARRTLNAGLDEIEKQRH